MSDSHRSTLPPRPRLVAARRALRTPRAAAVAGIIFGLLQGASLIVIWVTIRTTPEDAGNWITDDGRRNVMILALNLMPFAGIAFLWFIGVVRDRVGAEEDRFFSTVFLGSGLLFVAMLFACTASATALIMAADESFAPGAYETWSYGRRLTINLFGVYAMRMAAVFVLSTTTLLMRLGLVSRSMVWYGFGTGTALLVTAGWTPVVEVLFPVWVLVLSTHILVATYRRHDHA